MSRKFVRLSIQALLVVFCLPAMHGSSQQITKIQRGEVLDMLHQISPDIQKHYYDPKLHGVDWKAVVEKAEQKINAADSVPQATTEVGAVPMSLNDSRTYFLPPPYRVRFDYGWQAKMIGDHYFVVRVEPGSDAEKQGVKPGDEVLAINGYAPTRENLWKMYYSLNILRPLTGAMLELRDPAGQQREVQVATKVVQQAQNANTYSIWDEIRKKETEDYLGRGKFAEAQGGDVGIVKLPSFEFSKPEIGRLIGEARKHQALVLDLRGNPGGSEDMLEYLIGSIFEKDVKIGDRIDRRKQKPIIAKAHDRPFTGKLVVLVDSESASSAELFARVVQIEKRGTVLGDRSAGAVMEAKEHTYNFGTSPVMYFGASITDANIVMTDGKSLEHTGVTPDDVMFPTAADLAAGRDPVLSYAVETLGGKLTAEAAGKLFPYEWPKI